MAGLTHSPAESTCTPAGHFSRAFQQGTQQGTQRVTQQGTSQLALFKTAMSNIKQT
jgi:hypothetical protein